MQPRPTDLIHNFDRLIAEIDACNRCAGLPLGPRPVVRGRPPARLLIVSQAPSTKAHETGLSFNDRSGDRLRLWLRLAPAVVFGPAPVAPTPTGFLCPRPPPPGGE